MILFFRIRTPNPTRYRPDPIPESRIYGIQRSEDRTIVRDVEIQQERGKKKPPACEGWRLYPNNSTGYSAVL